MLLHTVDEHGQLKVSSVEFYYYNELKDYQEDAFTQATFALEQYSLEREVARHIKVYGYNTI